jgi:hypothetical protein
MLTLPNTVIEIFVRNAKYRFRKNSEELKPILCFQKYFTSESASRSKLKREHRHE